MLILVQIDDRSGEVLGHAVEELMDLGARNVQLLSALTKKGRPGYVLLIDLEPEREAVVATYLASELGAWGYQVLESRHRHFDTVLEERVVLVVCGGRSQTFTLPCKFFYHDGRLLRVKVERSDVEAVQQFVSTGVETCSTDTVRSRLEDEVLHHPTTRDLVVRLW
jgi:pyridinium-3,5-bisthiocarboxylic acid mononucleotide nickel chelatase